MNIGGIDLNLLLAFEALMDERHVGRAARRVGLSQPAFSNAIARLRTRLGDLLFVRKAQGMTSTPRAEQLAGPIRSALAQLRQTFEAPRSFDPSVSAQRFRIGLSDDVELRLAPLFARSMLSGELQMQTRRLDSLFTVPESELRNGTLDLAIGYFPDARYLAPGLIMEPLSEENNVVIARRGHSVWKRRLTLAGFIKLDHAAVIYRNQVWGLIDNELAARGLRRRLRLALPHCLSVLMRSHQAILWHASRNRLSRTSARASTFFGAPSRLGYRPSYYGWFGTVRETMIRPTCGFANSSFPKSVKPKIGTGSFGNPLLRDLSNAECGLDFAYGTHHASRTGYFSRIKHRRLRARRNGNSLDSALVPCCRRSARNGILKDSRSLDGPLRDGGSSV